MTRFNVKVSNRTTNLAGGGALKMDAKHELVHGVLSTFLEDKYYESGDERIERLRQLIKQNDPVFVAKLAVFARTVCHLRSVSHVLIGELAKIHRGDSLVSRVIEQATERPDDLVEIASYIDRPMPKQVKRGIRHALLKFSSYQLAKYRMEGKKWTLVDLFNIAHPNPKFADAKQKKAWKLLMEGKLVSTDTWETELSNAKDKKKALENLILENKMGYMAVLRNLNNFIKYDIGVKAQKAVIKKLTDPDEVKKSKQLPFRFYTAYLNVKGNREYSDAISEAMDLAVDNAPKLDGNILIAVDSSGSMTGDSGKTAPIVKAAVFAATLLRANVKADVIQYDTEVVAFSGSGRTPVVDLANRLVESAHGGGTDTSLVFQYAYEAKKKYDRIVILSDQESWAGAGSNVQAAYLTYRKAMDVDPFLYAIDIEGYGTNDVESPKVRHLVGWSDRVLDFMKYAEKNSLIDEIDSLKLIERTYVKTKVRQRRQSSRKV